MLAQSIRERPQAKTFCCWLLEVSQCGAQHKEQEGETARGGALTASALRNKKMALLMNHTDMDFYRVSGQKAW
jgi:hypothetical protein